jgi:hypothetical protein
MPGWVNLAQFNGNDAAIGHYGKWFFMSIYCF